MHDPELVHEVETEQDLLYNYGRLLLGELFDLDESLLQITSGHELTHHVEVVVVLDDLDDTHQVDVLCPLEHIELLE